jgi:hypothetical protein
LRISLTEKHLKFNNPLISVSDLDIGYDYQPEIINHIDRFKGRPLVLYELYYERRQMVNDETSL